MFSDLMQRKELIFTTIILAIALVAVSSVLAINSSKPNSDDLVSQGKAIWIAHGFALQNFTNYKWIQVRFLKLPVTIHNKTQIVTRGNLKLDNETYTLRNISFASGKAVNASIYLNRTLVGSLNLTKDLTRPQNIWIGDVFINTTDYKVFVHRLAVWRIPPILNASETVLDRTLNEVPEGTEN